ncbi:MAG: hypothetical protein GXD23_13115 [Comamonadaceae bacterium]|jgi:hypothetical protein|nr:hypothetical protein [Comamonadaceae bacterium]
MKYVIGHPGFVLIGCSHPPNNQISAEDSMVGWRRAHVVGFRHPLISLVILRIAQLSRKAHAPVPGSDVGVSSDMALHARGGHERSVVIE